MSSAPECFQECKQVSRDQTVDSARRGGPEDNIKLTCESKNVYFISKASRTLKSLPPFHTLDWHLGRTNRKGINM